MFTQTLVRNSQERVVGRIDNHIFIKEVYGSRHMLRQPMAWSLDADVFDKIISTNCYSIHVIDRDTGYKYVVGVKFFREHKHLLARGHGRQYYLEIVHWDVRKG